MAGLVYNGLRPLDLAANSNEQTNIQGDVHLLDSIPFNYRERNPRLFVDTSNTRKKSISSSNHNTWGQMQQTNPSVLPEPGVNDDLVVFGRAKCNTDDERYYDPQCFSFEGSGDELITPVYTPPTRPKLHYKEKTVDDENLCGDDEDCREVGSGDYYEGTVCFFN